MIHVNVYLQGNSDFRMDGQTSLEVAQMSLLLDNVLIFLYEFSLYVAW